MTCMAREPLFVRPYSRRRIPTAPRTPRPGWCEAYHAASTQVDLRTTLGADLTVLSQNDLFVVWHLLCLGDLCTPTSDAPD